MALLPAASWLPFTVTAAVAEPPEPVRLAEPSAAPPRVKLTEPLGDAVPELARTVAAITVFPAEAMPAGVAVTLMLVVVAGTVTVIVAVPTEPPNPPLPAYTADKLLVPAASRLPFTVKDAVAVPPAPARLAVP